MYFWAGGTGIRTVTIIANCGRRDMLSITTKKESVQVTKGGGLPAATQPADTSSDEEESVIFNRMWFMQTSETDK